MRMVMMMAMLVITMMNEWWLKVLVVLMTKDEAMMLSLNETRWRGDSLSSSTRADGYNKIHGGFRISVRIWGLFLFLFLFPDTSSSILSYTTYPTHSGAIYITGRERKSESRWHASYLLLLRTTISIFITAAARDCAANIRISPA